MKTHPEDFSLTKEDIQKTEQEIASFDLSREQSILSIVPKKLESILKSTKLTEYTVELINDVTRLYNVISAMPTLNDDIKKRILFALDYFIDNNDEIPDGIPEVGYIDDLVVVRYVVNQLIIDNQDIIQS